MRRSERAPTARIARIIHGREPPRPRRSPVHVSRRSRTVYTSDAPDLEDGLALLAPRRRPSQYATTTAVDDDRDRDDGAPRTSTSSTRLSTSPRSSRSFASMSSRVTFSGTGRLVGGLRRSCSSASFLASSPLRANADDAGDDEQHDDHDQVRHPRPVAGEGVAGLGLQRAQSAAIARKKHADAEQHARRRGRSRRSGRAP